MDDIKYNNYICCQNVLNGFSVAIYQYRIYTWSGCASALGPPPTKKIFFCLSGVGRGLALRLVGLQRHTSQGQIPR